jgi:hypothetical protein
VLQQVKGDELNVGTSEEKGNCGVARIEAHLAYPSYPGVHLSHEPCDLFKSTEALHVKFTVGELDIRGDNPVEANVAKRQHCRIAWIFDC